MMLQRTKLKIYFLIVVHLQGATETTAKKLLQLLLHTKTMKLQLLRKALLKLQPRKLLQQPARKKLLKLQLLNVFNNY